MINHTDKRMFASAKDANANAYGIITNPKSEINRMSLHSQDSNENLFKMKKDKLDSREKDKKTKLNIKVSKMEFDKILKNKKNVLMKPNSVSNLNLLKK